jgi:hypothetical protein
LIIIILLQYDLVIKFKPISYVDSNKLSLAQFEAQREISNMQEIENEEERNKKSERFIMKKLSVLNMSLISMTIESISIQN